MSLLINGMDMPKCCMECICLEAFDDEIYGRQHFCELLGIDALAKEHSRHNKCPLSEIPTPHGRLIDADRLYETIEQIEGFGTIDNENDVVLSAVEVLTAIDEAPTIIEAEG